MKKKNLKETEQRKITFVSAPDIGTKELKKLEKLWNAGEKAKKPLVLGYEVEVQQVVLVPGERLVISANVPPKELKALNALVQNKNSKLVFTNYHVRVEIY